MLCIINKKKIHRLKKFFLWIFCIIRGCINTRKRVDNLKPVGYRINSNSRYFGNVHISSLTRSSNLSIS